MQTYCTTFCNQPHDLATGKPVDHNCFVLNKAVLKVEREEGATAALDYMRKHDIRSMSTGREHHGLRRR